MNKRFDEKTAKKYISQLIDGLEYLHGKKPPVIHRDIKAENLLLDKDNNLKIVDFSTQDGTLLYLSPEQLEGPSLSFDPGVDIWAVGILIYEFLTGSPPFMPS